MIPVNRAVSHFEVLPFCSLKNKSFGIYMHITFNCLAVFFLSDHKFILTMGDANKKIWIVFYSDAAVCEYKGRL